MDGREGMSCLVTGKTGPSVPRTRGKFGLVITAIASALNQATAGGKAQDALRDMEDKIAGRLGVDSIRIVEHQGGIRNTSTAAGITVGLAAGQFVVALIYAALQ
jgi:hypothetical protein